MPTITRPHHPRFARAILALAAALGTSAPSPAETIFVNAALTTGANDGTSWPNAFQGRLGIQSALPLAQAGDEIWVTQGTYAPGAPGAPPLSTFNVPNGVALLGGFLGIETAADQRNHSANPTILTGDLNNDDTPIDPPMNDNVFHIVTTIGGAGTVIDGFTIERGFALSRALPAVKPDIGAGGGIIVLAGAPTIRNCLIRENSAESFGGGLHIAAGNTTVEHCHFTRNRAAVGANLNNHGSNSVVRGCSFTDATLETNFGAGLGIASGVGIGSFISPPSTILIEDCDFSFPSTFFIAGDGLGIKVESGEATIRRCRFINCTHAGSGGGISAGSFDTPGSLSVTTVDHCLFVGCEGAGDGGAAIYTLGASAITITNSVFSGNDRLGFSTIFSQGASFTMTNCTIANNGGANMFHAALIASGNNTTANIHNCIFRGNLGNTPQFADLLRLGSAAFTVNRSLIQTWTGQFPGNGTINANPLFADADGPDNIPGTIDDDLRLSAGSPAIDRGDNSFLPAGIALDFANCPRFADDPSTPDTGAPIGALIVDAGAHEFLFPCPGDASTDLMVGLPDIAAIIQTWNSTDETICTRIDLDHSGVIGLGDIALVIQHWGESCS